MAIANSVRRVLGFENATVCLKTVMDQCYTDITDVQENQLFIHAPEVIQHIRSEGCVTDQFLDSIGVPKLPGDKHIDRDGLVPWRRHAYLLSHRYSKESFVNYLQIRNDNNNPVLQQQRREMELAMKLVRKAELLREREDLATQNKAVKLVAKVAEKARREALTVAERKAEDLLKRIENQLRKAAKVQEAEDQLARARLLVA